MTHEFEAPAAVADAVIARMLGEPSTFFREYWRKAPLHVPAGGLEFAHRYDVDQFLSDVVATQPVPYLAVTAQDGNRVFRKCANADELRQAVAEGGVSAIKASKFWHRPSPESWAWMRTLFGSLCRAAAMMYMSPPKSEDVDIFLAGPDSGLGTHFDTTDVFTLQICGERRWTVDESVQIDKVLAIAGSREWYPAKEIDFQTSTREFTLKPGDTLYVPAYGVHRVTGVTWSVSLSLGLRAFNEIDVVEHLLEGIRLTRYLSYVPAMSFPASCEEEHIAAKQDMLRKVRALLSQIEGAALANLIAPLRLPADLEVPAPQQVHPDEPQPLLGMFRSGFALER